MSIKINDTIEIPTWIRYGAHFDTTRADSSGRDQTTRQKKGARRGKNNNNARDLPKTSFSFLLLLKIDLFPIAFVSSREKNSIYFWPRRYYYHYWVGPRQSLLYCVVVRILQLFRLMARREKREGGRKSAGASSAFLFDAHTVRRFRQMK